MVAHERLVIDDKYLTDVVHFSEGDPVMDWPKLRFVVLLHKWIANPDFCDLVLQWLPFDLLFRIAS